MGLEPTTPGLKDVGYTCCSMLLDTELEHFVNRLAPDLYLMCCPLLGAGAKFVNKSVNKMGIAYGQVIGGNPSEWSFRLPLGKSRSQQVEVEAY